MCIVDAKKYDRNEFIFNFALVIDEDTGMHSYERIIRKLARLFRNLEEQGSVLSIEEAQLERHIATPVEGSIGAKVYALCEMLLEDLNNHSECMIPIGENAFLYLSWCSPDIFKDESNTLNFKLFPTYPSPAPIKAWHVPLSTVRLSSLIDDQWDLTMTRIIPYINGVNSVSMIANLSDTDLKLACKALTHLLYYGCLLLLDIFQFSAIYAPTADIGYLFSDSTMQDECARYVSTGAGDIKRDNILRLYTNLRQGFTLKTWCMDNRAILGGIDVRRFISFGVIKGIIYRVHRYAISEASANTIDVQAGVHHHHHHHKASLSKSGHHAGPHRGGDRRNLTLEGYLDGMHCFDEICTSLQMSEKSLIAKLKSSGDVQIIHR